MAPCINRFTYLLTYLLMPITADCTHFSATCRSYDKYVIFVTGHQNVSDVDGDDDEWSVTSLLTRSDAGLYTCVVKNIAGHVTHNVSLFIEGWTTATSQCLLRLHHSVIDRASAVQESSRFSSLLSFYL